MHRPNIANIACIAIAAFYCFSAPASTDNEFEALFAETHSEPTSQTERKETTEQEVAEPTSQGEGLAPESQPSTRLVMEEIIVTGDLLGRNQQDVAASIERLSAEDIQAAGTYSYHDLIGGLANVTQAQSDRQISIRGVLQNGNAAGDSPLISIYLDGIPLPARAASFGGPLSAFDLDSIEVVRGPQSTSRGRNSLAGAVYLKTPDARPEWHGKVQMMRANHNGEQLGAVLGGPLVNENFAFRASYEKRNTDGDITNVTRNEDDAGRAYTETAKLKLAYLNPDSIYSNELQLIAGDNEFGDNVHDASNGERTQSANERYSEQYESQIAAFKQQWRANDIWTIHSQTGYARGRNYRDSDFDRTEDDGGVSTFQLDDDQFSQEFRANRDANSKTVVGSYFSYSDQLSIVTGDDAVAGGGTVSLDGFVRGTKQISTYALFAEHEQPFFERWALVLGARWNNEHQQRHVVSDVSYSPACPPGSPAGCNATVPDGLIPDELIGLINLTGVFPLPEDYDESGDTTHKVLLPKAVLRWDYADSHNVALSYQEGYRSGGTSISFFGGEVNNFDPEFTKNYELAFRNSWFNGQLSLDSNLFYIEWKDQQVEVGDTRDYFTVVRNAGRSHLYGVEFSSQWFISPQWSLNASLGLLRTEYDEFQNLDEDYAGNEFNYAPRETASLSIHWQPIPEFTANLGASYTGEYFSDPANDANEVIPARTLYNARLSWEEGNTEVFVFGRNLTDEDNIQDRFVQSDRPVRRYGESRTLGAGITMRF